MRAEIRRAAEAGEYKTLEGCSILEIANDAGDEFVSVARARVGVGVTTELHCLRGTSERYVILSGAGRVELNGRDTFEVSVGDVVRIPPDMPQRITNIGDGDLVFYCICTPPFKPGCYRFLETRGLRYSLGRRRRRNACRRLRPWRRKEIGN
ncbi:Cupin domain-containing protein [Syntrophus gentianae]|uniref:Cupin domain-containing protein n=1 Tax=Syntrophus gentianae TaxID=43775 RepID=A0A1H8AJW3_9BACT|nr:cupin domain-containing protein [Syntrophus gentianae]SEM70284.1 Cupin domain-containing protein [Syntrophus gentianae]